MFAFKTRTLKVLGLLFFASLLSVPTYAQISVIVSPAFDQEIDESMVKAIFSGSQSAWANGSKVQVIDQPDLPVSKMFYKRLLNQPAARLRVQWTKLVLSGQVKAPIKSGSDTEVKSEVSRNALAIGFIDSSALDESVREVLRIE